MELRPIQAVLLAGRCVSRRTTAISSPLSYSIAPSLHRCLSSTRPSLSEAEAEATKPAPAPSMTEWSQQQQQQQREQPRQSTPQLWGDSTANNSKNTTNAIFDLSSLLPANSSSTPPSTASTAATTPPPPSNNKRFPWATPSSPALRRTRRSRDDTTQSLGILDTLKELNLSGPSHEDLLNVPALELEPAADIKYRLRPSIGRTIHLTPKVDLARGLALLNSRVRNNKVSMDFNQQRFHERPGLKRKRLRSERWRARFKHGFKATCDRVQELARQGW